MTKTTYEITQADLEPSPAPVTVGRPPGVRLLAFLLAFEGVAGIAGGLGFLIDPSGALYGLPPEWLEMLPIADYVLPGLFLLLVLGAYPAFTAWALWTQPPAPVLERLERATGTSWPWLAALSVGVLLVAWIALEVVMLEVLAPIMVVWAVLGALIIALTLSPSVRGWARVG